MAKEPSIVSQLTSDEIRWIHAKIESWNGIDRMPYTKAFETAHVVFVSTFKKPLTMNELWRAFVGVRKMPKAPKKKLGMTPASERKKHQRYVGPIPGEQGMLPNLGGGRE